MRLSSRSSLALWAIVLATGAGACSSYSSYVEGEGQLGKVVVYRNGIAYYERKAAVEDGKVTLTVPADKVDDFLKSLTVANAADGKPLPINYPTAGANNDNSVDMTIQVQQPDVKEVVLTYITDAPAWKPSYRVVIQKNDKVDLQGWAIVDNTSGETWRKVMVGVGSSSALSFRFDLRSVRNVWRDTLKADERFAVAPPNGGATRTETPTGEQVVAAIDGSDIPTGEEQYAYDNVATGAPAATASPDGGGWNGAGTLAGLRGPMGPPEKPAEARRAQMSRDKVKDLAKKLNIDDGDVTLESYAQGGTEDAKLTADDRANWLRNELIKEGVAPGRLKVETKVAQPGQPQQQALRIVQQTTPGAPGDPSAPGEPVGESHFQSKAPITVERGTSAMVAVLDDGAEGDVVYLYDAESERGNARYAFKAIRFRNPTNYTLETGPMTVYGEGRFVGEGLTEPIPPRATAVVPFALDREVIVETDRSENDRITRLVTVQRGILRTEIQHERITKLKVTSVLSDPTRVFVRHSVRKGWDLVKSPAVYEKMGEAHLFEIELKPGETKQVEIVEATPMVRALDLRSPEGVNLVRVFLEGKDVDAKFAEPMKKLLAIYTEMAEIGQQIEVTRARMDEYRVRMQELEDQILTLKGVPNAGALMANLQGKLREMSDGVQKGTIEVVNLEQKLMMARIRFQDGVSELRIENAAKPAAAATPTGS
ncbi:MAG: hypothetical protein U1F43_00985 [Myxococcota bacterium]